MVAAGWKTAEETKTNDPSCSRRRSELLSESDLLVIGSYLLISDPGANLIAVICSPWVLNHMVILFNRLQFHPLNRSPQSVN